MTQGAAGDSWFIRNVADMPAFGSPQGGRYIRFEPEMARFRDVGVNIHILQPGQPNGRYHSEPGQEDFLVLSGEGIVIVGDVEHPVRAWDFVHCPGGTPHIFVGAGHGPCAILMLGSRTAGPDVDYPVSEVAARHGASVREPTDSPRVAYADWDPWQPVRVEWPPTESA